MDMVENGTHHMSVRLTCIAKMSLEHWDRLGQCPRAQPSCMSVKQPRHWMNKCGVSEAGLGDMG